MTGIMYGCARVSTRNQKEGRQVAALKDFGVAEKRSGKDFDSPLYQNLASAAGHIPAMAL